MEATHSSVAGRRNPQYPQELAFRLDSPVRLTQLQILSHEYKVDTEAPSRHTALGSFQHLPLPENEQPADPLAVLFAEMPGSRAGVLLSITCFCFRRVKFGGFVM